MTYLVTQSANGVVKINDFNNVKRRSEMPSYGTPFITIPKGPHKGYISFSRSYPRAILEVKASGASKIIVSSGKKIDLKTNNDANQLKEISELPEGAIVPSHLKDLCDKWMR